MSIFIGVKLEAKFSTPRQPALFDLHSNHRHDGHGHIRSFIRDDFITQRKNIIRLCNNYRFVAKISWKNWEYQLPIIMNSAWTALAYRKYRLFLCLIRSQHPRGQKWSSSWAPLFNFLKNITWSLAHGESACESLAVSLSSWVLIQHRHLEARTMLFSFWNI